MKKYTTPKMTCNSIDEGGFVVPAILGVVAGVAAAKVVSKAVDAVFDHSVSFYSVSKLEPVVL